MTSTCVWLGCVVAGFAAGTTVVTAGTVLTSVGTGILIFDCSTLILASELVMRASWLASCSSCFWTSTTIGGSSVAVTGIGLFTIYDIVPDTAINRLDVISNFLIAVCIVSG